MIERRKTNFMIVVGSQYCCDSDSSTNLQNRFEATSIIIPKTEQGTQIRAVYQFSSATLSIDELQLTLRSKLSFAPCFLAAAPALG